MSQWVGRFGKVASVRLGWLPTLALFINATNAYAAGSAAPVKNQTVANADERCAALSAAMNGQWPEASTRVVSSTWLAAGTSLTINAAGASRNVVLPEHCDVLAIMRERSGVDGQRYAIQFHVRLPSVWNQRFFFQGGGGSNGVIGDALGMTGASTPFALQQGFSVVTQDSGHDNRTNSDVKRGGPTAFGFDPQARADYGQASLPLVADAAKALIKTYYGAPQRYSYFVGCSKGGNEGMAFAQRYPDQFDGIIAGAPGFSLPRAAVAEAWDTQAFASLLEPVTNQADDRPRFDVTRLNGTYSDRDFALIREAVVAACDADDGVRDGMINAFAQCTTRKVLPQLERRVCTEAKSESCLSQAQVSVLLTVMGGPRNSAGESLYVDWAWDAGIGVDGWRLWKIGSSDGRMSAFNVTLGAASLATVFTTPPSEVLAEPQALADFVARFDFDRDAPKIYAAATPFTRSAWDDIASRSADLSGFIAHQGRLLVPHGVSDPVFSINDTLNWYKEVQSKHRNAEQFVRVFPVPGMTHCGGGPSTDQYDAFGALMQWVEAGTAPDQLSAKAGNNAPWPGRTRPICAYPSSAEYLGKGDVEQASSFVCRKH